MSSVHPATFGWSSFLVRLLAAIVLVNLTYNPHEVSYFHWVKEGFPALGPEQAVAGLLLIIGWVIFLRATLRSLGPVGIGLAVALMAAVVWMLISWGLLSAASSTLLIDIVLLILAIVLAVGMSWSYVRRRLSGQTDVDDVDA